MTKSLKLILISFLLIFNVFISKVFLEFIQNSPIKIILVYPFEIFTAYFRIFSTFGIILCFPLLYRWCYLYFKDGLKENEKTFILGIRKNIVFMFFGFIFGLYLTYAYVVPTIIHYDTFFRVESSVALYYLVVLYLNNGLLFSFIFQIPFLIRNLVKFNLVSVKFFKENRKIFLFVMFLFCCFLSPPDIISSIIFLIPMGLLFELGIILSNKLEINQN